MRGARRGCQVILEQQRNKGVAPVGGGPPPPKAGTPPHALHGPERTAGRRTTFATSARNRLQAVLCPAVPGCTDRFADRRTATDADWSAREKWRNSAGEFCSCRFFGFLAQKQRIRLNDEERRDKHLVLAAALLGCGRPFVSADGVLGARGEGGNGRGWRIDTFVT